jgi:hypothetical protein
MNRYSTAPTTHETIRTSNWREGSSVSPMITAARPATMVPTPIEMSAPPCDWANSAPARPISAFDSAMPTSVCRSVETPWARAILGLTPVARIASPSSEFRNPFSPTTSRPVSTSSTMGCDQ